MTTDKTTGTSKWRVIKEIPPSHPERNPIPYGTILIAQTKLDNPSVVVRRNTPSENYYDTNETVLPKRKLIHYLEVYNANIRYKGIQS